MRRTVIPILTLGATLAVLSACGGNEAGSTAEYCDRAEGFDDVALHTSHGSFDEDMLAAMHGVEVAAPDEIKPEWTTYVDAFEDSLDAQKIATNPSRFGEGRDLSRDAVDAMIPATEAVLAHLAATCGV